MMTNKRKNQDDQQTKKKKQKQIKYMSLLKRDDSRSKLKESLPVLVDDRKTNCYMSETYLYDSSFSDKLAVIAEYFVIIGDKEK